MGDVAQGNALAEFLAFMQPLIAPPPTSGGVALPVAWDADEVLTSAHVMRGVFAGGTVITQSENGASVARAALPTAA